MVGYRMEKYFISFICDKGLIFKLYKILNVNKRINKKFIYNFNNNNKYIYVLWILVNFYLFVFICIYIRSKYSIFVYFEFKIIIK